MSDRYLTHGSKPCDLHSAPSACRVYGSRKKGGAPESSVTARKSCHVLKLTGPRNTCTPIDRASAFTVSKSFGAT